MESTLKFCSTKGNWHRAQARGYSLIKKAYKDIRNRKSAEDSKDFSFFRNPLGFPQHSTDFMWFPWISLYFPGFPWISTGFLPVFIHGNLCTPFPGIQQKSTRNLWKSKKNPRYPQKSREVNRIAEEMSGNPWKSMEIHCNSTEIFTFSRYFFSVTEWSEGISYQSTGINIFCVASI